MTTDVSATGRYIGQRVARVEDNRLISGRGHYIDDVVVPLMKHAAFVRSPVACGQIVSIDSTAARAAPGVTAVLTMTDFAEGYSQTWSTIMGRDAAAPPYGPLAASDVRFVGDPIAIVIADSRHLAEDAAELVLLDIDSHRPILTPEQGLAPGAPLVHFELGTNVAASTVVGDGPAVDHILQTASHVVSETVTQHRYVAVPMEGRGIIASWDESAELMTIWAATQAPHELRSWCSRMMDLPEHRIRVIMGDVGGGFGQKMFATREEMAVMLAARQSGVAVKWIEDRSENLLAGGHAREEQGTVMLGFDERGTLLAARIEHVENVGSYSIPGTGSVAGGVAAFFPGPYLLPALAFSGKAVYTNTCGRCAYRGPWMFETVLREQMMDVAARRMQIDPLELRRRNVIHDTDLPHTSATGIPYERISPAATLEQAAELIGYDAFRREQAALRTQGRYVGVGFGLYIEPSQTAGPMSSEGATLRIDPTGAVTIAMGTAGHGQSIATTMTQIVAEILGCSLEMITFIQGDTDLTPWGPGTGGSRTAVIAAGAAQLVAERMRDKLISIGGHCLEAAEDDLELVDAHVRVKGAPEAAISILEIAELAYLNPHGLAAGSEPGLMITGRSLAPPLTLSNACHACIVEIDPETGRVAVRRYVVSEDCGRMINPMVVEGQIAGGVAQGIGGVLLEHMAYDDEGNPLSATFMDYLLPTAAELPDYEYGHIETPSDTPGGFKGMGEGGAIGSPAAVINAVADALVPFGVTMINQPLSPENVLRAIWTAAGTG